MERTEYLEALLPLKAGIVAWNLWLPGEHATNSGLTAITGISEANLTDRPDLSFLAPKYRRKLSNLSAISLYVACRCLDDYRSRTGNSDAIPSVFASRHGEVEITLSLFEEVRRDEVLSPLSFSRSVHNTASGLFSILRSNRSEQTAIAAGKHTALAAITEAASQASEINGPVLCVLSDELIDRQYEPYLDELNIPHGLALVFEPEGKMPEPVAVDPLLPGTLKIACFLLQEVEAGVRMANGPACPPIRGQVLK